jgi:hypothetical protein
VKSEGHAQVACKKDRSAQVVFTIIRRLWAGGSQLKPPGLGPNKIYKNIFKSQNQLVYLQYEEDSNSSGDVNLS